MLLEDQSVFVNYNEHYDDAPVGCFTSNSLGIIIKANSYFLKLLQMEANEVIGKMGLQDILSIGSKMYFQTHYFPLLQIEGKVKEINLELQRKDKIKIPILINTIRVFKDESTTIFHSVVFDILQRRSFEKELITQRKIAEELTEKLRETNNNILIQANIIKEQIESLDRLNNIKNKFFSIIGHDIRGPLTQLNSFVSLVTDHIENLEKADISEMAQEVKFSLSNAVDLTNNLFNWAQSQMQEYGANASSFLIEELVNEVIKSNNQNAKSKNINLSQTLEENFIVSADKNQLHFILRNLVVGQVYEQ